MTPTRGLLLHMNIVHYIPNVLSENQRLQLIEDAKPLLMTGAELSEYFGKGGWYPGKQTLSDIHKNSTFDDVFNIFIGQIWECLDIRFTIDKAWVNWTDGDKQHECWHTHRGLYSAVYYMTPDNCGTQFEDQFIETEVNSLLVFPACMRHTAPVSDSRYERYTLAMELI